MPHLLNCNPSLFKAFKLCKSSLFGMGSIVSQEKKFLKVVFFSSETIFDGR